MANNAFAAKESAEPSLSLPYWTVLIITKMTCARRWWILTVGEGEARSDITFWGPSGKVKDKEDSKDWKMEHSHVDCPHSFAGLPVTFCLSDFGRLHEVCLCSLSLSRSCVLSLSLTLSLQLQGVWMGTAQLWGPGSPLGLLKMTLVRNGDLWPPNGMDSLCWSASALTPASQICEEEATLVWWGIFKGKLEGLVIDLKG